MGFMTAIAAVGSAVVGHALSSGDRRAARNAQNASADAATQQAEIAREQYEDWRQDFLPLQRQIVGEAKDAGGAQDQAIAAEAAAGDVNSQFNKARTGLSDRLASYGIDPSQGKYAANFSDMGLAEAATSAGAQTRARTTAIDRGRAMRMDVYNAGKGTPSSSMAGLGSAAGTNAMVAANAANSASRNAAGGGYLFNQVTGGAQGLQNWWNNSNTPGTGGGSTPAGPPDIYG